MAIERINHKWQLISDRFTKFFLKFFFLFFLFLDIPGFSAALVTVRKNAILRIRSGWARSRRRIVQSDACLFWKSWYFGGTFELHTYRPFTATLTGRRKSRARWASKPSVLHHVISLYACTRARSSGSGYERLAIRVENKNQVDLHRE